MLKKISLILVAVVMVFGLTFVGSSQAANIQLNLHAAWAANSEPDMAGYYFQNQDGNWWGWSKTSLNFPYADQLGDMLPLTPTALDFTFGVAPSPATGTLTFGLSAVDNNNNISGRTQATYAYNTDTTPPSAPSGFTITKRATGDAIPHGMSAPNVQRTF